MDSAAPVAAAAVAAAAEHSFDSSPLPSASSACSLLIKTQEAELKDLFHQHSLQVVVVVAVLGSESQQHCLSSKSKIRVIRWNSVSSCHSWWITQRKSPRTLNTSSKTERWKTCTKTCTCRCRSDIIPGELKAPSGKTLPATEGDPTGPNETVEAVGCDKP